MSYTPDAAVRASTDDQDAATQAHPRGRGFSILSRLAREQQPPADTTAPPVEPVEVVEATQPVEPDDVVEVAAPVAQVLHFDRPQPAPRHRRDDVDTEPARRSS
jgi:hypothetical protein